MVVEDVLAAGATSKVNTIAAVVGTGGGAIVQAATPRELRLAASCCPSSGIHPGEWHASGRTHGP